MQRIVPIRGGVKKYLENLKEVAQGDFVWCVLCPARHRLRHHGWYTRFVILSEGQDAVSIPVCRLLCPDQGKTISLLPDFCIPHHQTGPSVLAKFIFALVFQGLTLCAALREARPFLPVEEIRHSAAQRLRDRFTARLPTLRAYLARGKARFSSPPASIAPHFRPLAAALETLREGHADLAAAFLHHGRHLHRCCQVGLL
jgi:hypothetical protein